MNRKFKLFFSLASLCLSIAMLCFGVYSAMSVSYTINGSVSYEVTDVFVKIDLSVYRSMSTAPIGSGDNSTNASKIQSAEDITSLGFEKIDDFHDSVSSYNPETGEVEHPGQDWTAKSYDGLNFTYGTPGEQDSNAYAFYIVLDITNYGSETINATVTNNTESTTANTRSAQTDDVEIKASNGEPYSTNRIVLGLALEDATQSISDAMGDFSYTVNVQRGNLEYQVISGMVFAFDDINKTASLIRYTGSATKVEIPSSVSSVSVEPKEACLDGGWKVDDVLSLGSEIGELMAIELPSTITFEDESIQPQKSLWPEYDLMDEAYPNKGKAMTITPLYVENGGSYTINEEFFGENGFAIPSRADDLLMPLRLVELEIISSVTYKVGNATEVIVTVDNVSEEINRLTPIATKWINSSATGDEAITFSDIQVLQTVEGKEYNVTHISGLGFDGNTIVESVTIPSNVISIGIGVFAGCTSLTDVNISSNVTTIGDHAFYGCTSLTSVTFEDQNSSWTISDSSSSTIAKIASNELSNPNTMATYLKSTYLDYTWTKNI